MAAAAGCEHQDGEYPGFDDAQGVDAVEELVFLEVGVLRCAVSYRELRGAKKISAFCPECVKNNRI